MAVDRDDVLDALQEATQDEPVATATELADEYLDVTRRTVLQKLNVLEAAGVVRSKTVGARARVWWPVEGAEN